MGLHVDFTLKGENCIQRKLHLDGDYTRKTFCIDGKSYKEEITYRKNYIQKESYKKGEGNMYSTYRQDDYKIKEIVGIMDE